MLKIERVLLPTDFSTTARAALEMARETAELTGAELHLLYAVVLHSANGEGAPHAGSSLEQAVAEVETWAGERLLEESGGDTGGPGPNIVTATRRGISAAQAILDYAQEHRVDLVVMGTHGRRGVRHLLMGSVAEEVVRRAGCPVLTVRGVEGGEPPRLRGPVLVPFDFSGPSETALARGVELAEALGTRLQALHVISATVYPDPYHFGPQVVPTDDPDLPGRVRAALERRLREVAGDRIEWATLVREGAPAEEIVRAVEAEDAGLIVIASHGLTGLERVLVGSVTERVIRRAACPVLTVRVGAPRSGEGRGAAG